MRLLWIAAILVTFSVPMPRATAQVFFLKLGEEKGGSRRVDVKVDKVDSETDPSRVTDFYSMRIRSTKPTETATPQRADLQLKRGMDELYAMIPVDAGPNPPVVVIAESEFNSIAGKKRFVAKVVAGDHALLDRVPAADDCALEIVPKFEHGSDKVTFKAYSYGKPLPKVSILVVDPAYKAKGLEEKEKTETLTTNDQGETPEWEPHGDGTYRAFLRQVTGEGATEVTNESVLSFTLPLEQRGDAALIHKVKLAAKQNLLGPLVLFFFLGFVAKLLKSDLNFPEQAYKFIVIYLLLKIGYEGGHDLRAEKDPMGAILPLTAGFVINGIVAIIAVFLLLRVLGFDVENSCALGALYGSDSAGLYAVGLALVQSFQLENKGFMAAMLAVMEIPGVLVGIILYARLSAKKGTPDGDTHATDAKHSSLLSVFVHELKSPGVFMLLGGIVVGCLTVDSEYVKTEPLFIDPFRGIMCLFLFENGLKAGEQVSALKTGALKLVLFGTLFPLCAGCAAVFIGKALGLPQGSALLFAVMVSAPSNIAAPAAMRLAIPKANPSIYFTTGLAISFPTLVVIGVPLFYVLTEMIY